MIEPWEQTDLCCTPVQGTRITPQYYTPNNLCQASAGPIGLLLEPSQATHDPKLPGVFFVSLPKVSEEILSHIVGFRFYPAGDPLLDAGKTSKRKPQRLIHIQVIEYTEGAKPAEYLTAPQMHIHCDGVDPCILERISTRVKQLRLRQVRTHLRLFNDEIIITDTAGRQLHWEFPQATTVVIRNVDLRFCGVKCGNARRLVLEDNMTLLTDPMPDLEFFQGDIDWVKELLPRSPKLTHLHLGPLGTVSAELLQSLPNLRSIYALALPWHQMSDATLQRLEEVHLTRGTVTLHVLARMKSLRCLMARILPSPGDEQYAEAVQTVFNRLECIKCPSDNNWFMQKFQFPNLHVVYETQFDPAAPLA